MMRACFFKRTKAMKVLIAGGIGIAMERDGAGAGDAG